MIARSLLRRHEDIYGEGGNEGSAGPDESWKLTGKGPVKRGTVRAKRKRDVDQLFQY